MYDPVSLSMFQRQQWLNFSTAYFKSNPIKMEEAKLWASGACHKATDTRESVRLRMYRATEVAFKGAHYFVEERFKQLALFAADTIPMDTVFDESILPTQDGWAYIQNGAKPVKNENALHVLAWMRTDDEVRGSGYQVMFLREKLHELRGSSDEIMWTFFGFYNGQTLAKAIELHPTSGGWLQMAYSVFHLMGQRLAVSHEANIRHNVMGKFKKEVDSHALPRIVMLRRAQQEGHYEAVNSGREYTCQWHVQGHWRRQPYRSTGEVRPVFIEAYIKGPEDKPLKAPQQTIFVARR